MTNCIAYICDFNPKFWSSRRKCNDWDGLFVLKTNLRYQIEKVISVETTSFYVYILFHIFGMLEPNWNYDIRVYPCSEFVKCNDTKST